MKELLATTLKNATWPEPKERDKVKAWMKEIGERVKKRMLGVSARPGDARNAFIWQSPGSCHVCPTPAEIQPREL